VIYVLLIIFAVFLAYAAAENCFMLLVRHERLGSGIRIAHVSDLHKRHFGRNNERLCRLVEKEAPDVIFVTGDLVSRSEKDFFTAENTLKRLCSIAPVYMISGNHEQSIPREKKPEFEEMVGRTKAVWLRNSSVELSFTDRRYILFGLEERYEVYKKDGGYRDLEKISSGDMEGYLGKRPEGEVLLLAHNPFFAEAYSQWGADVVFSGHVHGGIVRLFGKGILSPERKLFPRYSKGVYTVGRTKLLVSGGLGKLRLFNSPEIVIYD
jgi:hypothetical protein